MYSPEEILRFFLPEIICDYFELTRLEDHAVEKRLDVYLDERKILPVGYESFRIDPFI